MIGEEREGDLKKDFRKRDGLETLQRKGHRKKLLEKGGLWSDKSFRTRINFRKAFQSWINVSRKA